MSGCHGIVRVAVSQPRPCHQPCLGHGYEEKAVAPNIPSQVAEMAWRWASVWAEKSWCKGVCTKGSMWQTMYGSCMEAGAALALVPGLGWSSLIKAIHEVVVAGTVSTEACPPPEMVGG